ncbi:MAG: hypothetical protein LBK99_01425 [Opitutaceae bacterium]|nr:hypothetical protein [Opitutaceae bacterium]
MTEVGQCLPPPPKGFACEAREDLTQREIPPILSAWHGRPFPRGAGVSPADGEAAVPIWHGLPARGRRKAPPG